MRSDDAIPDAPVYTATLAEMENLEELLAKANEIAMKYGAVRIDPPSTWAQPPLRMAPKSRFFVRMQTLPAAPFADPQICNHANAAKNHPRKRARRSSLITCDEYSDENAPVLKQQKTTGRDRAARAASRSHRNSFKPSEHHKQALLDHLAKADFHSRRTPPQTTLEAPPNPHCTPVPSPPPELRRPTTTVPAVSTEMPPPQMPKHQSFARPSSREPCVPPNYPASGQSQAVREAALRLTEAFTGPAKAGPVQNATAIPPCPFSQQIAQEHISKRTAEEQYSPPSEKASPAPPSVPILPALTTQAPVAKGRNALETGSACGIVGDSAGIQPRASGNEALIIANTKPHSTGLVAALPNNQTPNLKANTSTRDAERKDWSRLAIEHYVNRKDDEALLLDDTRIPRINSQSSRPLSAAKQIAMRTPWVLQSGADNGSSNATYVRSGPPQTSRNTVSSAFPGMQPSTPKEPLVNYQAIPSLYHNANQLGVRSMNVSKPGSHVRPRPSIPHNMQSIEGEKRVFSVPQPKHFPALRSAPAQSYGSRSEYRDAYPPKTTLEVTAAPCEPKKDIEYPSAICTAKVVPVIASGDHLKKEHHKISDEVRNCEPRQIPDEPFGHTAQPFNISLRPENKSNRGEEAVLATNVVAPPTEAMEVSKGMRPKSLAGIMSAPAAYPLVSQPTSHMLVNNANRSLIPEPCEGGAVSSADGKNSWNSCRDILEKILAIATQNVGTEPLHAQLHKREEGVNTAQPLAIRPEPEQATLNQGPNNQPNSTVIHVSKSTLEMSPLSEGTPGSCRDQQGLLERATQIREELRARDSQALALSPLPAISATLQEQRAKQQDVAVIVSGQPVPLAPNKESAAAPESAVIDSLQHQQTSSRTNRRGNAETAEDLVVVSERRNGQHQGHPLMNRPKPEDVIHLDEEKPSISEPKPDDIIHLDEEKPSISKPKPDDIILLDEEKPSTSDLKQDTISSKPAGKRTTKRKTGFRNLQVDQDEVGRLTRAIVFPDSGTPVSLASYEKKAQEHHEETRKALNGTDGENMNTSNIENVSSKLDLGNLDALEAEFWKAMSAGVRGRPVTVAYGVDVEAEGAFDSNEMSYVEWHGAESAVGSTTKKRKRGRPRNQKRIKPEGKQQLIENAAGESNTKTPRDFPDGLHGDADDEMHYNGNNPMERSELHAQIGSLNSNRRGRKNKRLKPPLPRSHVGTLNRNGLLRHMPRMPGINHSMYYVGQLFTRFCWHIEDAFLNSVSYLHPGSAEKIWYAVPPRFASAFEEFAASSVFSPSLLETESAGRVLLMNKTTMFDPRRVRRKGVEVYRVVHKPGSFVLTAPRAYHAGFNCGFNIAEAVNFANPTWFPVGREASLFARQAIKPLCVPWEYLLFHEAKALRDATNGISKKPPSVQRLESNARVVAKELKATIMNGEQKIRKYAEAKNCRVSMLHEISGLAKHNQLGPEFGNGAGMVCSLCSHACHFYAEMCASCDDTFEARCVDHFGKGHRLCLFDSHKTVIVRRHDPVLLLDILGCLERHAGITVDAHELAQRYVGYLRTWQTPLRTSGLRLRLDLKAATSRLPPKVSKEKGDREKIVKAKIVRGKAHREKRRKIRKPFGTLTCAVEKKERDLHAKAEILEGIDIFTAVETNHGHESEAGRDSRRVFDDIRDVTSTIPLL